MKFTSDRLVLEARRSAKPLALLAGLAVLAGVLFAGIARDLTFVRPWDSYRTVRVAADDVKGIFPGGHQVRISGVKVGIVSKSELVNGRPVLTLKIKDQWGPIYKNARLRIRPVTPLEDLYVDITNRGDKSAGEATKSTIISADQMITPVSISRVLDTFNADTRQRLTILLSELGKGLGTDGGQKLRSTFVSLAPFLVAAKDATRVLADRKENVKRVINNFGQLSDALAKRDKDLNRFVVQGDSALGELARNDQPLASTLTQLSDLLPVMRSSLASVNGLAGHLDPALKGLEPVTASLKSGLTSLQQFGKDATPALAALRPATRDLRTMARTLPSTSSSLSTTFTRLRPQAPQLDRITAFVPPCLDTLQNFFQNTLSVFKFGDVNGSFPRATEIVDASSLPDINPEPLNLKRTPRCADGK